MSSSIENFIEWAEESIKPVKDLITENYSNPIMWIILLAIGIFLFTFTYDTLNKNG